MVNSAVNDDFFGKKSEACFHWAILIRPPGYPPTYGNYHLD